MTLDRCSHPECPAPDSREWHQPWCAGSKDHKCFGGATHQHWPKKGMGGHNPNSRIVACLCVGMHDAVDNGTKYNNAVVDVMGVPYYWLYKEVHENHETKTQDLVWRPLDYWRDGDGAYMEGRQVDASVRPAVPPRGDSDRETVLSKAKGVDRGSGQSDADDALVPEEGDFSSWWAKGQQIADLWQRTGTIKSEVQWQTGDFLIEGEMFGEQYAQADELFPNLSPRRVVNIMRVCRAYEETRRRYELSFEHHDTVASRNREEQDALLEEAVRNNWSREQIREAAHGPRVPPRYRCKNCGEEGEIGDFERVNTRKATD